MNESPWQPPTEDGPERDRPVPTEDGPERDRLEPTLPPTGRPAAPSPWSPEGAGSWSPPEPAWPAVSLSPGHPLDDESEVFLGVPNAVTGPPGPLPSSDPVVARSVVEAPVEPSPSPRRSKLVVVGVVAAVVAIGLAGLFALQRLSGEDDGGASSADELGLDLMAAIEAEDVLGVIDTMLPGERESLGDPFVELVGELQRLEVLSADTDLSRLLGLDVELSGEVVQVLGTNVPDIVNVSMEADAAVTLDGATLPLGAFLEEQLPQDALTELRGTRLSERDRFELELTAVQHGDRWYFSLFHTIAELARDEIGDDPIPVEGVAPDGGDSPEEAVQHLLDRVERLDLRGVIAILDPAEAAALQRYAPLFLDDAEAALADAPLDWQIDTRDFRVDGDGGERTVIFDALGITGELDGSPFAVSADGECVRGLFDGESFEECGASSDEELDSVLADAPAVEAFVRSLEEALADLEPIGLELRERDGAWFVSPLATGTDALLAVMRALDRSELDALVDGGEAALDELFDVFLGGFGFDEDFGFEDDSSDSVDDGLGSEDGPVVPGGEPTSVWDECYEQATAADAAACFERYVATGEIDEESVPAALLHPECGLAELTWEGGLFSATDDEFAAALEAAVPCFRSLVERGELDEWMLPFEVRYADCFEGRNWYTEFDDDAYNDRVDACISAG